MNSYSHQDWLAHWARYTPNAIAFQSADTGESYSYKKTFFLVNAIAEWLTTKFSIRPGDRVAVLAGNELETHFLFFALARLGAILVPCNFRLAPRELSHILRDCDPKILFAQTEFASTLSQLRLEIPALQIFAYDGPESYSAQVAYLQRNLNPSPLPFLGSATDPVMILYTSGTTGKPKGALITHQMLFWNSISTGLRLNIAPTDAYVSFLPLFHTSGWNVLTTPFLHHGARIIFLKKFDPEQVLELCERERATILFGVPTTMDRMSQTNAFKKFALRTLRFAIVGGEAMPIHLIQTWQNKGIAIRQGFGLTEFGPNVFSLNAEDSVRKIGSIGFPNFYISTRVVDENNLDVPQGKSGELLLQGPACSPGYWRNPSATAQAIVDGWLHTGDIVRQDDDGYFYVVDRKKDMYISGGENVYPLEVEHFLRTHPEVAEVAVIGIPDRDWGETGKAFIVPKQGHMLSKDTILSFCQGNLAKYKIPKQVEFLNELPKGDSGKILKRALKDWHFKGQSVQSSPLQPHD